MRGNDGSFAWSDSCSPTVDTGPNQFVARASGGFTFYTAPGSGTETGAIAVNGLRLLVFLERP